jgi:phosphoribosylglycinamide formyltransferase-1
LLPEFKGAHAIGDALAAGADFTGVTVHFVDEKVDHGPVILQRKIKIRGKDTLASLEKRIHILEHKLYPQAIQLLVSGKIKSPR